MSYAPPRMIAPFYGWTQFTPALPEFYWNVYSAEERIKKICMELHKLCDYANMLGENINLDHETIAQLEADFEKFIASGFEDYYEAQIQAWIQANAEGIISDIIKMVFFGLTQTGYFTAYVPDSWSDVGFDTGMNYEDEDYGRLILTFDDAPATIDYMERYNNIVQRLTRTERTLYTDVSEGGE